MKIEPFVFYFVWCSVTKKLTDNCVLIIHILSLNPVEKVTPFNDYPIEALSGRALLQLPWTQGE